MAVDSRTHKVFSVIAPVKTHFRPAKSCEEVDCERWRNGFKVSLDPSDALYDRRVYLIKTSGRHYAVSREGQLEVYRFEAGQDCFDLPIHKVRNDKPHKYYEKNRAGHVPVEYNQWADDFAVHQEILKRDRG